MALIKNIPLNI